MSITLGSNISGVYVGGSKIGSAYLGSSLIYTAPPEVTPANTLLIRFDDTSFTPPTYYGTWTKKSGSQYNDWYWTKAAGSWQYGFSSFLNKYRYPSFSVIDAGDLSGVTSLSSFFAFCEISNDIYDVLEIILSKTGSALTSVNWMFFGANFSTFSKWNTRLNSFSSQIMFAYCVNWPNPKQIYDWAANTSSRTSIAYLAGSQSSAGRSNLRTLSVSGGGLKGTSVTSTHMYFGRNYYTLSASILHMTVDSSLSSSSFGRGIRFPSSAIVCNSNVKASLTLNTGSNTGASFACNKSFFYGHGSYDGHQANYYSGDLYISFSLFQIDPDTGNLTWQMNTTNPDSYRLVNNSDHYLGKSWILFTNKNKGAYNAYTGISGTFIPRKPVFISMLAGYSGKTSVDTTNGMIHNASDYFVLLHGSTTKFYSSSISLNTNGNIDYPNSSGYNTGFCIETTSSFTE